MSAIEFDLTGVVTLGMGLAGLGGILVTLGRVLERQKAHGEALKAHDDRISDMEAGHSAHTTLLEGFKVAMENLSTTLSKWIDRMDRYIEKEK